MRWGREGIIVNKKEAHRVLAPTLNTRSTGHCHYYPHRPSRRLDGLPVVVVVVSAGAVVPTSTPVCICSLGIIAE